MRILFSTGSAPHYMAPPQLADEQINCGPYFEDQQVAGRFVSLHTPKGEYDLATVAARLPADQQPDAVVCLVDASWINQPQNLGVFKCPKVLLIADTHHMNSPLVGTLRYMASEPFDRCILLYDRHHAAFFHAAGFRNVFWLPGLTFPHTDAAVLAARMRGARSPRIAFVGQAGKHHPRRARLLEALTKHDLPVVPRSLSQADALGFYGSSLLGFNASLNGDFNLRILEIMATGGALLTDRLAPDSGFDRLLVDGRDCRLYGSPEELVACAAEALAHPGETRALGAAGARWFDEHFNQTRRRQLFQAVVFDGVAAPEFDFSPEETSRVFFGGDTDRLLESLVVYEGIQEIHRAEESVHVQIAGSEPADLRAIFATLPRVECTAVVDDTPADLMVFDRERTEQGLAFNAPMLWCWNAQPADFGLLAQALAPAGYALASRIVALFCQQAVPAATPPATGETTAASGPLALTIGIPVVGAGTSRLGALLNSLGPQAVRFTGRMETVVTDASAGDDVRRTVENYRGRFPIRYVRTSPEGGLANAIRELADVQANGVFTWVLGEGDLLRASAVAKVLEVIAQQPTVDFIYTNSSPRTPEEFAAKARGGMVCGDDFPVNGPMQVAMAADRPELKFNDLLAPVFEDEVLWGGGGSVFRTEIWRQVKIDAKPCGGTKPELADLCPLGVGFAHTMVGRAAYGLACPLRVTFGGTNPGLERTPVVVLRRLPELLALYAAKGVLPKHVAAGREVLARHARDSLRTMLLDAATPGFAEFDLVGFLAGHHVGAHHILDGLDAIVREAGLREISNRLVVQAQTLVQRYPSHRMASAATDFARKVEAFQRSVNKADELLRAGAIREAVAELTHAKAHAPNAESAARAEEILAMLMTHLEDAPPPSGDIFSAEERTNIFGIISAFEQDPTDTETLGQLRALKSGLLDFLNGTEPARVPALLRSDFGLVYRKVASLSLGDDQPMLVPDDLAGALAAEISSSGEDPMAVPSLN